MPGKSGSCLNSPLDLKGTRHIEHATMTKGAVNERGQAMRQHAAHTHVSAVACQNMRPTE